MKFTSKYSVLYLLPFTFLIFFQNVPLANGKPQFVQPLNWGMNMCLAYDIANIFNRPIGAVTSVFLAGLLAAILFFGVITAPFGYMFGIPSRKYVLGGDSNLFPPLDAPKPRNFPESTLVDFIIEDYGNYSERIAEPEKDFREDGNNRISVEFLDNALYLMPKIKDENCRQLIICMAHGSLQYFPRKLMSLYKLFSRKLTDIPGDYRKAMILGFKDKGSCGKEYDTCSINALNMIVQTLTGFLPEWTRRKAPYNAFP